MNANRNEFDELDRVHTEIASAISWAIVAIALASGAIGLIVGLLIGRSL